MKPKLWKLSKDLREIISKNYMASCIHIIDLKFYRISVIFLHKITVNINNYLICVSGYGCFW